MLQCNTRSLIDAGLSSLCMVKLMSVLTSCVVTSKDKCANMSKVPKHKGNTHILQQQARVFCLHA